MQKKESTECNGQQKPKNKSDIAFSNIDKLGKIIGSKESGHQVREMLNSLPEAIYMTDAEGNLTYFNSAAADFSGHTPELNRDQWCVSWKLFYPDGTLMPHKESPMAIALKEGRSLDDIEVIAERPDGKRIWFEAHPSPIRDDEGNIIGGINMLINVTDRIRSEHLHEEQEELLELIASGTPLNKCLSFLCNAIFRLNPNVRASIFLADEQGDKFKRPIAPDLLPSFGQQLQGAPINDLAIGTCGTAVYDGEQVKSSDIANDDKWAKEWRDLCLANDVRACCSNPIFGKDNQPAGSLMLCFNEPREPNEWDHKLADFGTHIASIAIERDRSYHALHKSEEKYQRLFESIDEGFCILEVTFDENKSPIDYRFEEVNPAFEKLTGLENVEGKSARELVPEYEEHWYEIYGKVALTGEATRFTRAALDQFFNVYAFPFGQEDSNKVAVLFDDVTERKQAQQEHEQLLREVEAERERLSDIFQHAPSIMAILNGPDHVFERANELYYKLVGDRDIIGKSVREAIPESEEQGFIELLDQVYETGEPFIGTNVKVELEQPNNDKKTEVRYLDFVYQPLHDSDGSITGIFAQGVDLTERKQAQEKLKEINRTLEERVEERTASLISYQKQLRSLASQLSKAEEQERHRLAAELHDNLGQMLAVNKMKMELLQKDQLADELSSSLEEIKQGMDSALIYTRNLMSDLKPPPSLDKEDITATIKWLVNKMEKHDLKVIVEDDGHTKNASEEIRTTLLQCVRELLFNVIKHAEVNKAQIKMSRLDDHVQIIVEDEGQGYDPKAYKSTEDGGFGLFNIRERMDVLGGHTEMYTEQGVGTKIKLLAPLKAGTSDLEDKPDEKKDESSFKENKKKIKVLLADDHEMMREGLKKIVEAEDDMLVVAEASDGEEALQLSHEFSPNVIIMDVNMPRMDGIEATQKILSSIPDVRIVGLSLHDHQEVIESMRSAGASAYLTKNEAFETLCATIRSEGKLPDGED